jgi:hypothetical protein
MGRQAHQERTSRGLAGYQPLALSLSKGEDGISWVDKLTRNGLPADWRATSRSS